MNPEPLKSRWTKIKVISYGLFYAGLLIYGLSGGVAHAALSNNNYVNVGTRLLGYNSTYNYIEHELWANGANDAGYLSGFSNIRFDKTGNPTDDVTLSFCTDAGSGVCGSVLASCTIPNPSTYTGCNFSSPILITYNNAYVIKLARTGSLSTSNYWSVLRNLSQEDPGDLYVRTYGKYGGEDLYRSASMAPLATLTNVSPDSTAENTTDTTVTLTGTNFENGDVAYFDGSAISTTYVSATSLTAVVPDSKLTTAGTYKVKVYDTSFGNYSNEIDFNVTDAPISWNGQSPVQAFRADTFGGYTVSASATAIGFSPVDMTIQAVRIDALYSPHHVWYCTSPMLSGTCDTDSFAGQTFESGTWRFLAYATDANGNRRYSNVKDLTISGTENWAEAQARAGQAAADQWLSFTGTATSTSATAAQQGFNTTPWDGSTGGVISVSTSTQAALHEASLGWTLQSDGTLCEGTATSTSCAAKTLSQRLLDYPLISWPKGIASAIVDAVTSASTTGATPLEVSIPAMSGAGVFSTDEVKILDNSSSTAGIGRWIAPSNFAWFRALMTGALYFQFVLGLWSRFRNHIYSLC